jgi:formylglycine-generating enzyme required for sulfatase activity
MTTESYPSAKVLADLEELLHQPESDARAAAAWRLLLQATTNDDFGVVHDYALEHNLMVGLSKDTTRSEQGPRWPAAWRNPCDGSEMVWVPPGKYLVGPEPKRSRDKQKDSEAPGFSLARHPVTNAQFKRFLDETGYQPPEWHPRNDLFLCHWTKGAPPKAEVNHPVTWVSYIDALSYCRWAGLTLPTEWLWEKAARGPDGWPYPWGKAPPSASKRKLINVSSGGPKAVGSYPWTRSVYGCEDLIGNVAEWCQMTPKDDPSVLPSPLPVITKPKNPEAIVMTAVRGSCYLRSDESRMVAWHRRRLSTTRRNTWVGFRPACLLPYMVVTPAPAPVT